jgi:hypothetical protein
MGKTPGKFGNLTRHAGNRARGGERQRCVKCGRPIVYGERCPPCARDLRQRQRRKPR